jgi:hypothetical protein
LHKLQDRASGGLFDHVMNVRALQSNYLNVAARPGDDGARRRSCGPADALRAGAHELMHKRFNVGAVLVAADLRKMEPTPFGEMAKRGVPDAAFPPVRIEQCCR